MGSPAIPGLILCVVALALLLIATLSVPIWDSISFLDVHIPGLDTLKFGVFGYTGSHARLGYQLSPAVQGLSLGQLNTTTIRNLTYALVLNPIAAGLSGLAVLFGLCGAADSRVGTILMTLASALACLAALVAFIIDMTLFGVARSRIRDAAPPGTTAQYGNANWLVLGAFIALLLSVCAGACGSCGRFSGARRNRYGEKV
ncbi:hypothetical protein BOTBODRAFT_192638 [Botryobasidium botryosum FD-172 SS1]|uniref:Pali-domain-containing protein n=1 Tax=Botryobasidium botryosum (strain FD-172 SS1) TaxID=930990 RepID=A0A067M582_BOTB1|nr:hypothetical protein BOTBODRAFT_192638 [Botryobasidium botryosum FD-172 SS1]